MDPPGQQCVVGVELLNVGYHVPLERDADLILRPRVIGAERFTFDVTDKMISVLFIYYLR